MNIKLKVTARTAHSEEWAIFDLDTRDEREQAVNIGKLDVHYVDDQIVGTLLIWQEYATGFARAHAGSDVTLDTLIDQILGEVSEPLGVPAEYGVEVYYPSVTNHYFVSNYAADEDEDEDADVDEYEGEYETEDEEEEQKEDDFARQLRERP